MTIPEAAQLVIQAASLGIKEGQGGDVFVLDMGEPVKIAELAKKMIHLSGFEVKDKDNPHGDIEIHYTGLRAGEKLYEELLIGDNVSNSQHPRIMRAEENCLALPVIEEKLKFRTAFFQSAKGNFEARPGLVHNLGFDKFWARDDLNDPNTYLGYLASDEFAMLTPITDWIKADERPFLLVVLCSATHDPYEVPQWFGDNQGEPIERYRRTLAYTASFIKTLDAELGKLGCGSFHRFWWKR